MNRVAIECRGIKKGYGENDNRIEALKGIDLEIKMHELTLLVGPSGSGKTTLLSIITNILTPDEGELLLLGQDVRKMPEEERANFCRKNLGIVFQSLFLIPTLSVIENVTLPLIVAGQTFEEASVKAFALLDKVHLSHRADSPPNLLSKGQQQRVAIMRAIINDATILICDEPTSSLDRQNGLEIMTLLHELALQASKAVLVVTHDHRIFPFADRIININDGQITPGEENV